MFDPKIVPCCWKIIQVGSHASMLGNEAKGCTAENLGYALHCFCFIYCPTKYLQ